MKLRNLVLATAGFLFFAFTSLAQITTIEGDVKGTDGKPIQGAVVKIERTDIKGHYQTKTDKKGHYFHTGLPMGMFNISVEIDGKQVDAQNGVRTRPGDSVPVNFDLRQAQAENAAKQAALNKAAESGQLSKDLERGLTAEQKKAMEESIKQREAAMKKNKELNDAFNAGMTALNDKQWDAAVDNLVKASVIGADQPAVWGNLASAYTSRAATKTGADFEADMEKGLDAYKKGLELKPDDAATHNNYALALAKDKKFPEAQAELTKAAQLDPANGGKYYYNLGALLVNAGQNEPAGDAFKKAIEIQPTYADAYYQYGITLMAKAQIAADGKITPVPGTVEAFQKYLELQPTGTYAAQAQEMLKTLGSTVDTSYKNPNAKDTTKKTTTKKK